MAAQRAFNLQRLPFENLRRDVDNVDDFAQKTAVIGKIALVVQAALRIPASEAGVDAQAYGEQVLPTTADLQGRNHLTLLQDLLFLLIEKHRYFGVTEGEAHRVVLAFTACVRYIGLLPAQAVPVLYKDVYTFVLCDRVIQELPRAAAGYFYLAQLAALENIAALCCVYTAAPDFQHWDDGFYHKEPILVPLPSITPPALGEALRSRAALVRLLHQKIDAARAHLSPAQRPFAHFLDMKQAILLFQNNAAADALPLLLNAARGFARVNNAIFARFCAVAAWHCTASPTDQLVIVMLLLALPPLADRDAFERHFALDGLPLLDDETLAATFARLCRELVNVPVFRQSTTTLPPLVVEHHPPAFVPAIRAWEGTFDLHIEMYAVFGMLKISGKIFPKNARISATVQTDTATLVRTLELKDRAINLYGLPVPSHVVLSLPVHGRSKENPDNTCAFTFKGETDIVHRCAVPIKTPLAVIGPVQLLEHDGAWAGELPLRNTFPRPITVVSLRLVDGDGGATPVVAEPLVLDAFETRTFAVTRSHAEVAAKADVSFVYEGESFVLQLPVKFECLTTLVVVRTVVSKMTVRYKEPFSLTYYIEALQDVEQMHLSVKNSDTFCFCGFTCKTLSIKKGETVQVPFVAVGVVVGQFKPPVPVVSLKDTRFHVRFNDASTVSVLPVSQMYECVGAFLY